MKTEAQQKANRIKSLEIRNEILQERYELLRKFRINILEILSRDEPLVFPEEPKNSGDMFKWMEKRSLADAVAVAKKDLKILDKNLEEIKQEIGLNSEIICRKK